MDGVNETAAFLGVSSPYVVVFVLLTLGIWVFPFAEELALLQIVHPLGISSERLYPQIK